MRRSTRRANGPAQVLSYWAIVVVVSLILGGGAFAVGKYLIGGMFKGSEVDTGAPRIVAQGAESENPDATATPPPAKAEVQTEQRAPTAAERSDLEVAQPQDGAELQRNQGSATAPDSSVGEDNQPVTDTSATPAGPAQPASAGNGAYTVVAGSFAEPANADKELSRLMGQGYTPYIVKVKRDGKTFHRVCVGSFAEAKAAQQLRDKLREEGTAASIARD